MVDVTPQKDQVEAERYHAVLELAVDYAYDFCVEPDGTITCEWASDGFERLTGYTPEALLALGGYDSLIHPDDAPMLQRRTEAIQRGESVSDLLRIVTRDGQVRWVKDAMRPELDAEGRVVRLYGAARDVTERHQTAAALRETRLMLEGILENSQEGVVLLDEAGLVALWNPAMERITGWTAAAVVGQPYAAVVTWLETSLPEGRTVEWRSQAIDHWVRTGEAPLTGGLSQREIVHGDGSRRVVQASGFGIRTAAGWRVGNVVRDVTERVEMERQVRESGQRLRGLTDHTRAAVEEERARISREIHDGLGQTLTALQFDIHWLTRRLRRTAPEVTAKLEAMSTQIEDAIGNIQQLASELRPHLLDDLGLAAAVEWQVQQFAQRTGLTYRLRMGPDDLDMEPAPATALFRVLQEALTNVARHAEASAVEVTLTQDSDGVELVVRDDGRGITPAQIDNPNALGLIGMGERVERWGGRVGIVGEAGQGTTVSVHILLGGRET
jgi:PAS domain S-box-containing protein